MMEKFGIKQLRIKKLLPEIAEFFSSSNLKQLLYNKIIKKRLFITAALLVLYYLCDLILIPTVDHSAIKEFLSIMPQSEEVPRNLMSSSSRFSILALGLIPYIAACFILQLLSFVVPYFHSLYHRGESRISLMDWYVLVLTLILSIIQAYLMSLWFENPNTFFEKKATLLNPLPFRILTTCTLTGGAFILVGISKLINRYGVGNGIGLILASQVFITVIELINTVIRLSLTGRFRFVDFLAYLGFLAVLIVATLAFTIGRKDVLIAFTRSNTAERVVLRIPLRFSWVAVAPIAFSESIVFLPATVSEFTRSSVLRQIALYLTPGNGAYFLTVGLLIIFFTFFYFKGLFSPEQLEMQINRYGGELLGLEGGEYKKGFSNLDREIATVIRASAVFLLFLAFLPTFALHVLPRVPVPFFSFLGADGVVVLVAVFYNSMERMYFFDALGRQNMEYSKIFCAFTEVEAVLKKGFLKSRGIDSLIEPVRFSWGIPIKTSLDHYNIHVPKTLANEGKNLLKKLI